MQAKSNFLWKTKTKQIALFVLHQMPVLSFHRRRLAQEGTADVDARPNPQIFTSSDGRHSRA